MNNDDSYTDEPLEVPAAVWLTRLHIELSASEWEAFKTALIRTPEAYLLTINGGSTKDVLALLSQNDYREVVEIVARTLGLEL